MLQGYEYGRSRLSELESMDIHPPTAMTQPLLSFFASSSLTLCPSPF